jgi:hypothetical protein
MADVIAGAAILLVAGVALVVVLSAPGLLLEHPEKPTTAIAARLAAATVLA